MSLCVYVRTTGIYDDSRATKEIQAISSVVDRVLVLSWDRHGDAANYCRDIFGENVEFRFFCQYLDGGIGIKNIGKLFKWRRWVAKQLSTIENIDIVHACNLDSGIGVLGYCRNHNAKLVYDIFDYYIDSHKIPLFMKSTIENIEIKLINYSNITIICTEERAEQIAKSNPHKVLVIHNSPDVKQITIQSVKYDYVYCGTMGESRLIKEILDGYKNNSDLRFFYAGKGANANYAKELSEIYDNFEYISSLPYSQVLKYESQALMLSAIYMPTIRNHRLSAPNKFYEALALGKPIIVCEETGIDRIVHDENIGCVISYDSNQFYQAVRKIKTGISYDAMCSKARELYELKYRWSYMRKKIQEEYTRLLEN